MFNTNKKKILTTMLIIICIMLIPLFFLSFETIHKIRLAKNATNNDVISSVFDEIFNTISSIPKNNDSSIVRDHLFKIFNLINENKFKELYKLLNEDIKENIFPSYENFETYMISYKDNKTYSPKFEKYQKLNNEKNKVFVVNVDFLPYSTEEKTSIEHEILKNDTFILYENSDNTFNFSFLSYIGCEKNPKAFYENEKFVCSLISTNLYISQTIFNIEIKNKTDSIMFINKEEISVFTGLMEKKYPAYTIIPPKSSKNIYFTIYTGLNLKDSLPNTIYIKGIHVDGKVYLFPLPIKYPIELW